MKTPKTQDKPKCSSCTVMPKKYRKHACCSAKIAGQQGKCAAMSPKETVDAYLRYVETALMLQKIGGAVIKQ